MMGLNMNRRGALHAPFSNLKNLFQNILITNPFLNTKKGDHWQSPQHSTTGIKILDISKFGPGNKPYFRSTDRGLIRLILNDRQATQN